MSKLNIQIFLKEIENLKTNNIYSNILLTFQNNLSVLDKLKLFYYQSQYYLNSKDFNNLTRIAIESIKIYLNEKDILIDENNKYFIYLFNIFYHTFEIYKNDEKKIIISYYFILLSKKMLFEIDNEGKNTPLKKINNEAKEIEIKLRSELNKIKNEKFDILENNGEKFLENEKNKLYKVVHNLLNTNISFIQKESDLNEGEIYYLISKNWLKKYYSFIELLISIENNCKDYNNFLAIFFDVDKQINNFHENNDFENNLSYIYKINNFWIENYKNILIDPDENFSYTNSFINEENSKKKNYVLIKENDWKLLSDNFDYLNEIKRFKTNGKLETNLFQLKILLINKEIKKINCDFISEKNIQISKFSNFKDLKEKIKRILLKILNKKDLNEKLINYYKNTQNEEIQIAKILLSLENNINKIKIFCEELNNILNETKITDFLKEKDLIIIEIKSNLNQQNFIIPNDLNICNNCSKNLENSTKKQCNLLDDCLCLFCSNNCLENDKNHKNFHEILNKYFKKKINLTDLKSFTLNSLLNKNSKFGLVGLNNLGNTCFMNSALQCLSNCEDLTKFFLSKNYLEEINKNNPLGTKGSLANAYYNLLKKLWLDSNENFSPNYFRTIFIHFVPQFSGFEQQDSNEFLTILIDKLHEDLNRISKKPYFEMKNKRNDESDKEASNRWWKLYKLREDSIIVDLFHGQFKSKIYCPECGKISINFDPFMFISLPIPTGRYNVNVRYVNNQNNFDFFNLILTENSTSNEFKEEIVKKIYQKKFKNDNDYLNLIDLILVDKNKKIIKIFNENEFIFEYLYKLNNELIAYQKEENKINIYLYLTKYNIDYKFFIVPYENIFYLDFYPFKISLNLNEKLSKIYQKINEEIIKIFFNDENDETKSLLNEKNFIINENNECDLKYLLHFNSYMNYENDFCDFCGFKIYNYLDHHCRFIERFKKNEKLTYILSKISQKNFPLILDIQLLSNNLKFIGRNYHKSIKSNNNVSSNEKNLDIYDCLNLFRSEEKLQEDNMWYCSNCKKHQMAFKKIDIYKEPLYLIIQLKRFKQNNYPHSSIFEGLYSGDGKNSTFIDFPVKNLDLSKFIIREDRPNKILYDLYAVTNHFGGSSFGHYTADCKNNGAWYNFNDSSVMRIQDEREIVNSSAYILFYKKKNI